MTGYEIAIRVNRLIDDNRARNITDALRQIGEITGDKPGSLYQRMWRAGVTRTISLRIPTEE